MQKQSKSSTSKKKESPANIIVMASTKESSGPKAEASELKNDLTCSEQGHSGKVKDSFPKVSRTNSFPRVSRTNSLSRADSVYLHTCLHSTVVQQDLRRPRANGQNLVDNTLTRLVAHIYF